MSERDENPPDPAQPVPGDRDSVAEPVRLRQVRIAALVAGAAALSALVTYGFLRRARTDPSRCAAAAAELAVVWSDERRHAVCESLRATRRPYASDTCERVERGLDAYTAEWKAAHARACDAGANRDAPSRELATLRSRCLEEGLGEMAAVIDVLADTADAVVLEHAIGAVADLDAPATCDDASALGAAVPRPGSERARIDLEWLHTQLDRARALQRVGKYEQALTRARGVAEGARAADSDVLLARALLLSGSVEARVAGPDAAQVTVREAVRVAERAHDQAAVAEGWIELLGLRGGSDARRDEALAAHASAAAAVARAGDRPRHRAALLTNSAAAHLALGDLEEARTLYQKALAATIAAFGPDHLATASALTALAGALTALGDYDQARERLERALAITEAVLGPDHPGTADTLSALANVDGNQGKYADAEAGYRRVLAIREQALGIEHPDVAECLYRLGVAVGEQHQLSEALALLLRALEIQRKTIGIGHPDAAWTVNSIGVIHLRQGRLGLARARFHEALALFEKSFGSDHANVAYPLEKLGEIATLEGRFAESLDLCRRAQELGEAALGADHPALAHELTCVGNALIGLRRPADAIPMLERALSMRESNPAKLSELAHTRFALARALWDARRDRKHAFELAVQAVSEYEQAGASAKRQYDTASSWVTARSARFGERRR